MPLRAMQQTFIFVGNSKGIESVTLPRKSGEKVWNVFYKKNDASNCSGMQ
ncbi:hypothetical protein [Wolbachia endosymbiont of Phyllotreta cruciferae]|nr:hypothetical protein [Wolbachia endosymbiont of Phyllotreta cruciferae]